MDCAAILLAMKKPACLFLLTLLGLLISIGGTFSAESQPQKSAAKVEDEKTASFPKPPYPDYCKLWRQQGTVVTEITVSPSGEVEDVTIIKSSGHSTLDLSTKSWIKKKWRFSQQPTRRKIQTPFVFQLGSAGTSQTSFPVESKSLRLQKTVQVDLAVAYDAKARPTEITVLKSSGSPELDSYAMDILYKQPLKDSNRGKKGRVPVIFEP
jgi:TonB family protein